MSICNSIVVHSRTYEWYKQIDMDAEKLGTESGHALLLKIKSDDFVSQDLLAGDESNKTIALTVDVVERIAKLRFTGDPSAAPIRLYSDDHRRGGGWWWRGR